MKALVNGLLILALAEVATPAKAQFSGSWTFDAARSENVGMMSAMQWTVAIRQAADRLILKDDTVFGGQHQTRDVTYDLTGREVQNPGPMGESCVTQTKWEGGALVTTWTSDGAVAGSKVVKIETRSLSADGRTMRVESRRGLSSPLVMVFEKK